MSNLAEKAYALYECGVLAVGGIPMSVEQFLSDFNMVKTKHIAIAEMTGFSDDSLRDHKRNKEAEVALKGVIGRTKNFLDLHEDVDVHEKELSITYHKKQVFDDEYYAFYDFIYSDDAEE